MLPHIPSQVNILGYKFQVYKKPILYVSGKEVSACVDTDEHVIFLATKDKDKFQIFQSFMHEVTHAIKQLLELPQFVEDGFEESEVDGLAIGLTQFILNNKLTKGD